MARTTKDIDAAKNALLNRKEEDSTPSLPPGYIAGFQLEVNDEGQLIINKGIVDICGKRIEIKELHIVSGEDFFDPDHILYTFTYYIYLNAKGEYLIDMVSENYNVDFFGFYHYTKYDYRYIGQFKIHTDGTYYDVFQQDPIKKGGMSTTAVEALFLAAINAAIIGYSGSGINESPTEGDRRVYIDNDEIGLEEYTGGRWSTVNGIKIGGAVAGLFLAMIGCTGIYHPENIPTATELFPTNDYRIFNFDNNYEDQNGLDDWNSKLNCAFNSTIKKFDTYSLFATAGNTGFLQGAGGGTLGESQSLGAYFYLKEEITGATETYENIFYFLGDTAGTADGIVSDIYHDVDNKWKIQFRVIKNGIGVFSYVFPTEIICETWNYVAFSYDSTNDILFCVVNNEIYTSGVLGGTWDTPDTVSVNINSRNAIALGGGGPTISLYIDEFIFAYDEYINPEIWVQHYNHGVTWNTGYSWADILIQPNTNGRVYINSDCYIANDLEIAGDLAITGIISGEYENYDTGWVSNADWTNAEFTITHNLNVPLSDLVIKFLISTDGTDDNSIEVAAHSDVWSGTGYFGFTIYAIDDNSFYIQTGAQGIRLVSDTGSDLKVDTENWYYKVKVWKLG